MWYKRRELIYDNPLSEEKDVENFVLEGQAAITFSEGKMNLKNTLSSEKYGQKSNIVFWCDKTFPSDIEIDWDFEQISDRGLCIMFFAAKGKNGEDIFSPSLARRAGVYDSYHHGDINTFHISYYRRMYEKERSFNLANLRKSYGAYIVAQGADPLPYPKEAIPPYHIRIVKCDNTVEFYINDLLILHYEDDGKTYGELLKDGKIGFRQMSPMVANYSDFKVYTVERNVNDN